MMNDDQTALGLASTACLMLSTGLPDSPAPPDTPARFPRSAVKSRFLPEPSRRHSIHEIHHPRLEKLQVADSESCPWTLRLNRARNFGRGIGSDHFHDRIR